MEVKHCQSVKLFKTKKLILITRKLTVVWQSVRRTSSQIFVVKGQHTNSNIMMIPRVSFHDYFDVYRLTCGLFISSDLSFLTATGIFSPFGFVYSPLRTEPKFPWPIIECILIEYWKTKTWVITMNKQVLDWKLPQTKLFFQYFTVQK